MKKVSKKKLRRLINKLILTIVLVLFLGTIFSFSNIYKSYATDSDTQLYIEVIVQRGDTLWTIADQYNENQDLRKLIYEIKKLNRLDQASIYPGQKLVIPAM